MIRRLLARRRPGYECVHGIEWALASAAAYCGCDDDDD